MLDSSDNLARMDQTVNRLSSWPKSARLPDLMSRILKHLAAVNVVNERRLASTALLRSPRLLQSRDSKMASLMSMMFQAHPFKQC